MASRTLPPCTAATLRRALLPRAAIPTQTRLSSSLPTVAQPAFWRSLIPKPFRREERLPDDPMIQRVRPKRSRQWNPATFYIVVFLLIGSMAINSISLRQSFETFMRQTDVRIGLLREVVERIQRGEKFDVEKALGAGNAAKEQEWADILKEIQREEITRDQRKDKQTPRSKTEAAAPEKPAPAAATPDTTGSVKTQQGTGMSSFF
ncbi:hypothetical protein B0T11DRAFT_332958 [Plectosphaerella cucumerina]|uniref:Uncharacterized protein n=1 Tax=Plectosphaerella cucumerina TaxID=40658 RepID=A0A8K0X0T0_9PEZI|nr:hypothetical protein B0T11DRAFT_332958 [Plectosphaerella cucumerina]